MRTFLSDQAHLDIAPLDYNALAAHLSEVENGVPIVVRGVIETDDAGVPIPERPRVNASFQWKPRGSLRFYGLVLGGWVPPVLGNGRVAFLDRNIVYRLRMLAPPSAEVPPEDIENPEWLYRVFAESHFEVSPAMHLLEGGKRRAPTIEEMEAELRQVIDDLSVRLPNATLHRLGPVELGALHELLLDRQESSARKRAFLVEVAPLVAVPVSPVDRRALEDRVFAAAARAGVLRTSLVVVAVLSCIYESPQLPGGAVYRPGRAVLKPKPHYSEAQAYNAVADLDALELLVGSCTLLVDYGGVFFTEDVGLVAFWAAMGAKDAGFEDTSPGKARSTMTVTLSQALVPGLSDEERQALTLRLQE